MSEKIVLPTKEELKERSDRLHLPPMRELIEDLQRALSSGELTENEQKETRKQIRKLQAEIDRPWPD
jgi:transcription elongation GreA/GreB family factor